MMLNNFLTAQNIFLILAFFLRFAAEAGNTCEMQKCNGPEKKVGLCFYDSKYANDLKWKIKNGQFTVPMGCLGLVKYKADSMKEVSAVLQASLDRCESIKTLRFIGHGFDGYQFAGNLKPKSVQAFKKYSCLFDKNTAVQLHSCNVAQGCAGEYLMQKMAENIFPIQGQISANIWKWYPGADNLPGLKKLFGLRKTLFYKAVSPMSSYWQMEGQADFYKVQSNVNITCQHELKSQFNLYQQLIAAINQSEKCKDQPVLSNRLHNSIQQTLLKMQNDKNYIQNLNPEEWSNFASDLEIITSYNKSTKSCF